MFLLVSRGGVFDDDEATIPLAAPALVWVPAGSTVHRLHLEAGARGHHLVVAEAAVAAVLSGLPGGNRIRHRLRERAVVEAAALRPVLTEIEQSLRALTREAREPRDDSPALSTAHLSILSLHIGRLAAQDAGKDRMASVQSTPLPERFRRLVEAHIRDGWSVSRYADALGVSPDRLHASIRRGMGRTPGGIVAERLAAEARAALVGSDLPAEQIAYALGFRDPAYFSRFCRKHLGAAPIRFRREARVAQRRGEYESFASWP